MATETIYKLQPNRTMYLRGFDRRGASASFHNTSSSGWTVSGIFRDFADFAVLVVWDADDFYNHLNFKPLPDFNFQNMVLSFNLAYNGELQGIESPKFPWIAWDSLSYIKVDPITMAETPGSIKLWDHAALASGTFSVANNTWTLTQGGSGVATNDQICFYYLDIPFNYTIRKISVNYSYFNSGVGVTDATGTLIVNGLAGLITAGDTASVTITPRTGSPYTVSYASTGADSINTMAQSLAAAINGAGPTNGINAAWSSGNSFTISAREYGTVGNLVTTSGSGTGSISVTSTSPLAGGSGSHFVKIGPTTYTYVQLFSDSSTDIATGIKNTVNAGAGDPNATATSSTNVVTIKRKLDTGAAVTTSASDGNANDTIYQDKLITALLNIVNQINTHDWVTENAAMAIMASNPSGNDLKIQAARYGQVTVSGTGVTWSTGNKFTGVANGSTIYFANDPGTPYTISTVNSPTSITLTASGPSGFQQYLAEYGGYDGNMLTVEVRSLNNNFTTSGAASFGTLYADNHQLSGGNSNVTWTISIDFTALSIYSLRQAWLTFAPKMANSAVYTATEFSAVASSWAVSDPSSHQALKIANPTKSVRVDSRDARAVKSNDWVIQSGFYLNGYIHGSHTTNGTIAISYSCQHTHDLYMGTSLYLDRGIIAYSIDGAAELTLDTYANVSPELVTRRKLSASPISAGSHTIVFRVTGTKNAASSNYYCYFNYLEASVLDDVQDPVQTYTDVSAAIDFDTNHGYTLPPERLLWMMQRLGFIGPMNEYLGVFWWNQRTRVAGTSKSYAVSLSGAWLAGDSATVTLSGIPVRKTIRAGLDADSAALNLSSSIVETINASFSGVWAQDLGGSLVVYPRTPLFNFTVSCSASSASTGAASGFGDLDLGSEGVWNVDDTVSPYLNRAAKDWHADFFSIVASAGIELTVACSMELLNPPDDPGSGAVWSARYNSGVEVLTSTGFGTEAQAAITAASNATPIVITATGHGYRTGDPITVSGVGGNTTANGVWPTVTVVNANQFSLDGSSGSGSYTSGGIAVRNLRTTQCAFTAAVVAYQKKVYNEIAGMMNTAGLTPWLQFGEFGWWFFSDKSIQITGASNTSPITVTAIGHQFNNGEHVVISGVRGNTAANGTFVVSGVSAGLTFQLSGTTGNGAFIGPPDSVRIPFAKGGSMAYYDQETTAAALAALGVALHIFNTQDDANVATYATHTAFLSGLIKSHIDTIRAYVLGNYAGAKFEILYPYDTNNKTVYLSQDVTTPMGGRVNAAVNLPSAYQTHSGSGLDRFKVEGLSWSASYRSVAKSDETFLFPRTAPNSWTNSQYRPLVAVFNGGCQWQQDYLYCRKKQLTPITFWANDQFHLFSWPIPLPNPNRRSEIL